MPHLDKGRIFAYNKNTLSMNNMKTILTNLIARNNFKFLNVTGKLGMGKHNNITDAVNDLGLKHFTLEMASLDLFDIEVPGQNTKLKVDENTVLILSDLDRTSLAVFNKVVDGITRGTLFGLDLEKFVLVITTQEQLDVESYLINRSVILENK